MRKNALLYSLKGHSDTVTGLTLSPDGSYVLSNSMDNSLRVWDIRPFAPQERCIKMMVGHAHNFEKVRRDIFPHLKVFIIKSFYDFRIYYVALGQPMEPKFPLALLTDLFIFGIQLHDVLFINCLVTMEASMMWFSIPRSQLVFTHNSNISQHPINIAI